MKSIEENVRKVLCEGVISPEIEAEISEICGNQDQLSLAENQALDQLMEALLEGKVTIFPTKRFLNIMEDFVFMEAVSSVEEVEASSGKILDLGDITAYALNRLPPLYATTKEGANFQGEHAQEDLRSLIAEQVKEAICHSLASPEFFPARHNITKADDTTQISMAKQISALLGSVAPSLIESATQMSTKEVR